MHTPSSCSGIKSFPLPTQMATKNRRQDSQPNLQGVCIGMQQQHLFRIPLSLCLLALSKNNAPRMLYLGNYPQQQCRRMSIIFALALKPMLRSRSRSRTWTLKEPPYQPACLPAFHSLIYFRSSYFSEIKLSTPTICLRGIALSLSTFSFFMRTPTTKTIYHMRLPAPVRILDECARSASLIQFILDKVTICA